MTASGLLLLNKKPGVTSFAALGAVKRAFGTGKAGHTGTLDRFASGLLAALVGRAVKLNRWLGGGVKEYLGTVRFGAETATLDPEGEVTAEAAVPPREAVEAALPLFRGEILQAPPEYSAVHIGGERAWRLAREGRAPEMAKRPVTVYALELLEWDAPFARIRVRCSAGTYIRSLARDIALAAGSRAHLAALVRTRIGGFSLEEAVDSDEAGSFARALKPLSPALFDAVSIPSFFVDEADAAKFRGGRPLPPLLEKAGVRPAQDAAAVFSGSPEAPVFTAMLERKEGRWGYGYVMQ
jgi:tRNA pseudouridine55 synthase